MPLLMLFYLGVHTAQEGVALLGHIIETQGTAEGFGVAFVDKDGIWYLETGSGHHWMAAKIPADKYFVSANQGRLVDYVANHPDFMASAGLVDFAKNTNYHQLKTVVALIFIALIHKMLSMIKHIITHGYGHCNICTLMVLQRK